MSASKRGYVMGLRLSRVCRAYLCINWIYQLLSLTALLYPRHSQELELSLETMSREFSTIQSRLRDRIQEVQSSRRIEEESATLADSLDKLSENTNVLLQGGQSEQDHTSRKTFS